MHNEPTMKEDSMKWTAVAVAIGLAMVCGGCASVPVPWSRMPILSVGTDVSVDSATWVRGATSNDPGQAFTIVGGKKNTDEGMHTAANVAMGTLGAIIKSGGGVAPAAGGAAILGGSTELWQTFVDWYNKSHVTPAPTPTPSPTPVATYGDACDAPAEDWQQGQDTRMGSPIPVSFLSTSPDKILDPAWCAKYLTESGSNPTTCTAAPTMVGRSGKVYVCKFWRVAHSDSPNINSNVMQTSNGGDVSRAYYECHNAK